MSIDLESAIAILERTPLLLRAWLDGLGDNWTESNTGEKTFSPADVLGHLIHGEKDDWMPRVRMILAHGESQAFEPFDRFAMWSEAKRSVATLLDEFSQLRNQSLGELKALKLKKEDLDRKGRHPELGPVTLGQLLATWTVHDLNHLGQIARTMAHQYREEVGPWRAYLGILKG